MADDGAVGDCTTDGTCEGEDGQVDDTAGAAKNYVQDLPLEIQTQQAIQQLSIRKWRRRKRCFRSY